MTRVEALELRSRAYAYLARLIVRGLDEESRTFLNEIPALAEWVGQRDPDDLAAEHHRLFAIQVFPYASVYLHPEGLRSGMSCEAALGHFNKAAFTPDFDGEDPDHFGLSLAFLAYLQGVQAVAVKNGDQERQSWCREKELSFLLTFLMPWIPVFLAAIDRQEKSLWTQVVALAGELLLEHGRELADVEDEIPPSTKQELIRPAEAEHEVRFPLALLFPAQCGFWLSRQDLDQWSLQHELPHGFGSREDMLKNLLENADKYSKGQALFESLTSWCKEHRESFCAWEALFPGLSTNGVSSLWWSERARQTEEELSAQIASS